jgi:hypothetical protein
VGCCATMKCNPATAAAGAFVILLGVPLVLPGPTSIHVLYSSGVNDLCLSYLTQLIFMRLP